jgi:methionine-rich copper-binding protein CopC
MVKQVFAPAFAVAGMILAGLALGHAKLRSSSPPDDAQLQRAPESLTLNFNENVRLAVLTLTGDGKEIPLKLDRNAAAAPEVTVRLPPLSDGRYQVHWSALSPDDGHVTRGTLSFTISGTPAPAASAR